MVVWKMSKCMLNCFTLEVSFAGGTAGLNAGLHFTSSMLEDIGVSLLTAFHRYTEYVRTKTLDQVIKKVEFTAVPERDESCMTGHHFAGETE